MTDGEFSHAWFRLPRANPGARVRLFCFPHAGGSAAIFHNWWKRLPTEIEVLGAQLPGREERFQEPCCRSMRPLVAAFVPAIEPFFDKPFALLGHSMGAIIAFELARQLHQRYGVLPRHLFVVARRAPQLADPLPPMHRLAEADFIRQVRTRHQGLPDVIVEDPELRAIYFPILRADLELLETYAYAPEAPLDCPLSVFGARADSIPKDDLAAWRQQTTSRFTLHMIAGDHFFLKTSPGELLDIVSDHLLASLSPAG